MTKKRDIERELREAGGRFVRPGANHDIWEGPNGATVAVPRYREIPERTADDIRREAGLKK